MNIARIQRVQDVLGCGDKLTSFSIDLNQEFEELDVEGEVLDIISEANDTDDELDERVDQESHITHLGVREGQHPQLEAVVELPAIDLLKHVLCHVVPDGSQMKAELADVLETKLVADLSID